MSGSASLAESDLYREAIIKIAPRLDQETADRLADAVADLAKRQAAEQERVAKQWQKQYDELAELVRRTGISISVIRRHVGPSKAQRLAEAERLDAIKRMWNENGPDFSYWPKYKQQALERLAEEQRKYAEDYKG